MTVLGYSEKDVWHMTLRKLMILYKDYKEFNGNSESQNIDELIP